MESVEIAQDADGGVAVVSEKVVVAETADDEMPSSGKEA